MHPTLPLAVTMLGVNAVVSDLDSSRVLIREKIVKLLRVHAFEVKPQRLATKASAPRGGSVPFDDDFQAMLDEYLSKTQLVTQPTVDLRRTPDAGGNPTSILRDQLLEYCFGSAQKAKSAAVSIARRLSISMDERSDSTLLMLAAFENGTRRRLVIWAFPKDEPLHFSTQGKGARIKVLEDAFSRRSGIKKGSLIEGENVPSDFWKANVIDKQAENGSTSAADYWIRLFMDSVPSLSGKAGTRLLAKCLKLTYNALKNQDDKDELSNAIIAIRASTKTRWSVQSFAKSFLSDSVRQALVSRAPAETRTATFSLNKAEFADKLDLRVFRTTDNVIVSAPFSTIGNSLKIDDGVAGRTISYEGVVVSEKVRSQHAG